MRRGPQRDWLTTDDAEPLDPDLVDDRLKALAFQGCLWDKVVDMDTSELEESRLDMKVYIARYTGVTPDHWEGREVGELRAWFDATCALVKRENGDGSARD